MTNDELKALCESNARAIQAQGVSVAEVSKNVNRLNNTVAAFIEHVSSEGLRVSVIQQSADDTADETIELERRANYSEASIEALRRDAIADRTENARQFDAQQEVIQGLLAQLITTNQDVSQVKSNVSELNDRVDELKEAS